MVQHLSPGRLLPVGEPLSASSLEKTLSANALAVLEAWANGRSPEQAALDMGVPLRVVQAYAALLPSWLGADSMLGLLKAYPNGMAGLRWDLIKEFQDNRKSRLVKTARAEAKPNAELDLGVDPSATRKKVVELLIGMTEQAAQAIWAVTEAEFGSKEVAAAFGFDSEAEAQLAINCVIKRLLSPLHESPPSALFGPLLREVAGEAGSEGALLWQVASDRKNWVRSQGFVPMFADADIHSLAQVLTPTQIDFAGH